MFLFQMVFMDTALTIVTGTRRRALEVFRVHHLVVLHGRLHVSDLRQLGVGRRLAREPWSELRPGPRLRGLRWLRRRPSSRRCHRAGDGRSSSDRASGKFGGTVTPNAMPGHDITLVLLRLLHPGVRVVRVQPGSTLGAVGERQPADQFGRRQHDAGWHGRIVQRRCITCGSATANLTRP